MSTPQERMRAKLESLGVPFREINVYGSQIVVTVAGRETAERWAGILAQFAKVRRVLQSWDDAKVNRNTVLRPSKVKVWRVFATV